MNNMPRLVLEVSKQFDNFVRSAQEHAQSAQSADIKAVVANVLGLIKDGSDYKFDVNSTVADVIFSIMDANNYKGKVNIDLSVDVKKSGVLNVICDPVNGKITAAVSAKLTPNVNAALKKLSAAPAETLTIKEIVSAWNQ